MPRPDSGSGGSLKFPSVSTSDLVSDFVDGRNFNFVGLLSMLLGGVVLAVYDGVIRVVLAAFGVPTALLDGLGNWLATFVEVLVGTPAAILSGSYSELIGTAGSAGIAGFAVAVGFVAFLLFEVVEVVDVG